MYEKRRQQNTPSKEKRDEEEKSKHLNDDEVKKEDDMKKKDSQKEEDLNENDKKEEVKNEDCQNENDSPFDNIDGITLSNESFCVEFNDNWEKLENGNKNSQKSTDEDSLKNNISDGVVLSEKSNKKKKRKRKNNVKKEKKEKNERNKKTQTNKKNKKNKKENKRLLHRQTKDKFELLDCINKTFEIRKIQKMNEGNVVDYYNIYYNFPISWDFLDYDKLFLEAPNTGNDEALTEEDLEAIRNIRTNHDWRRNNFYMNGFVFDTNYSVRYSVAITPTNDTTINK